MTTATTDQEGFDTVSQSGSGIVWTGLSNMPYPTEGTGSAELTFSEQVSNSVQLITPQEAAGIPTGSTFVEMYLSLQIKKTGIFSSGTDVKWTIAANQSSSTVGSSTQVVDETFQTIIFSGDRAYWRLTLLTPGEIIEGLKDGTLYPKFTAQTLSAIACGVRVKSATCTITYNLVRPELGAITMTLV